MKPEAVEAEADEFAPAVSPAPEPDDLTELGGIGPRMSSLLAARGVTIYSQLEG